MRVKEEANLAGISMCVEKSDSAKFICLSRENVNFYVFASQSYKKSFEIVTAIVLPMDGNALWDGTIPGHTHHRQRRISRTNKMMMKQRKIVGNANNANWSKFWKFAIKFIHLSTLQK